MAGATNMAAIPGITIPRRLPATSRALLLPASDGWKECFLAKVTTAYFLTVK
ncbi:MAG: hypothetical protein ACLRZZ_08180 [Enterocloster sp.]